METVAFLKKHAEGSPYVDKRLGVGWYKDWIISNGHCGYKCSVCGFIGQPEANQRTTHSQHIDISRKLVKNHIVQNHFIRIIIKRVQQKTIKFHHIKPWKDPESLFCDTKFLKKLLGKEPRAGNECKDR